ncbi:hypothetical protein O181_039828 [Austropuccinia psidii MF-1]|uniref:Uncharacterized protein n=1 Tax=Austropuccinia psidii MF-1 TaxID=1389203 RepID=A0A9Q3DG10_9BASI|nr:hypothetical protein [Austropuccinia psidii MF-1]
MAKVPGLRLFISRARSVDHCHFIRLGSPSHSALKSEFSHDPLLAVAEWSNLFRLILFLPSLFQVDSEGSQGIPVGFSPGLSSRSQASSSGGYSFSVIDWEQVNHRQIQVDARLDLRIGYIKTS